jgi:CRP-like cAMP-binding protein
MQSPLVQKLEHGADLSDSDRQALESALERVRPLNAHEDIIQEGDRPNDVHVIVEGFACRYKVLPSGERQIMAWLIPGDLCDLHIAILGEMDHAICTLAPSKVAYLSQPLVDDLTAKHPAINRALWWATLVDEGTLREWLVNAGRRSADKQMAHLFCELFFRFQSVGRVHDNSFDFPPTQEELADTLGISTVHVNRVVQTLREAGLITLRGKKLTVLDIARLQEFAEFNPNYLHLQKRTKNADARAGGTGSAPS